MRKRDRVLEKSWKWQATWDSQLSRERGTSCQARQKVSPKPWTSTKWEWFRMCTLNNVSSGETFCTSVQSQLQNVLARLKTGKTLNRPGRKWGTWAAFHFWEADDDSKTASMPRRDIEAHRNYTKAAPVGPEYGEGNIDYIVRGLWREKSHSLPLFRADYFYHKHRQRQFRSVICHDNLDEEVLYAVRLAVWRNDDGESGGSTGATVSVWWELCMRCVWEMCRVLNCVELEKRCGKHLSIQTKSERENQAAKLLATQKERFPWVAHEHGIQWRIQDLSHGGGGGGLWDPKFVIA